MDEQAVHIPGISHASFKGYVVGFILSVLLTIIPFALVIYGRGVIATAWIYAGIAAAAIVQITAQLHYFLHLDRSSDQSWNLQAILFAGLIIVILVGGSLWVMIDLHSRMAL